VLAPLWAHLNRRSSADLFRMVAELDSSFSQVKMLFLLEDGGEHSVKDIAQHLGLSLPAASRAVDGLIQRGYVSRRESAADRRSRLVALTGDGRAVVERVLRARLQTLEAFADELTPEERDRLYTALLPIVERIASP
jgi:DNA-binding MarR family transcriptional regulator